MDSSLESILETVISLIIIALCTANYMNFLGYAMFESSFGFGSLQEKSSDSVAYTVEAEEYQGFSQMQYYMLPLVDTKDSRTICVLDSEKEIAYSGVSGNGEANVFHKLKPILENTENKGNLDKPCFYVAVNQEGTLKFIKGSEKK